MNVVRDYYTVTLDYLATGEGHSRAILICLAKDEKDAREKFADRYGVYYSGGADVKKGIHIEHGYQDLITDSARKILLKVKNKTEDGPGAFTYTNYIHVNYS